MKKTVLYAHGGSGNHGCEALVRTTAALLKANNGDYPVVVSSHPEEDTGYITNIPLSFLKKGSELTSARHLLAKAWKLLTGSLFLYDCEEMKTIACTINNSLCISIGGDNYCYSDYAYYGRMNRYLNKNGNQTVLWGCSIEPELLQNQSVIDDLRSYKLITARESITYEALRNGGLKNVMFCPDSAFLLPMEHMQLPEIFANAPVVGINISPMVLGYEQQSGIVLKNYHQLLSYILENTNMNIALIPHVVWEHNNDLQPLSMLFEAYKDTGRIALVDSEKCLNCCQLKYVISQCNFLVTARTHASIAGYSTGVPTLVTGYSVKAKGIAQDIFGTYEHYVCPVQNLKTEQDLCADFRYIMEHSNEMKEQMNRYLLQGQDDFAAVEREMKKLLSE